MILSIDLDKSIPWTCRRPLSGAVSRRPSTTSTRSTRPRFTTRGGSTCGPTTRRSPGTKSRVPFREVSKIILYHMGIQRKTDPNSQIPSNEQLKTKHLFLFVTGHKNQQQGGILKQDSPQMQLRAQIEQEKELQRQQDLKRQQETFEAQQMQFQGSGTLPIFSLS